MRVATKIVVGSTVVGTESFHHMGPAQGTWWQKYSWWVIPLGFLLLIYPGWLTLGLHQLANMASWSQQQQAVAVAPQPAQPQVNIQPGAIVIQQPPAPQTPSASGEAKEAGDEPAPKPKPKSLWDLNP